MNQSAQNNQDHDGKEKTPVTRQEREQLLPQQSLEEYLLLKKMQEQRKAFKMPAVLKLILATPFILLFCAGLIFIPYMLYLFFTSL